MTTYEMQELETEDEVSRVLGPATRPVISPLSEEQEYQLANDLLAVSSEEELEQFLGDIIKTVSNIAKGPVGQALGGVLKNVAKTALPMVGGALGSVIAPGVGTAIGSNLGSMASNLFEVELEAMAETEAEFEVARRMVGLTAASARAAGQARPRRGSNPNQVARAAVAHAARRYAPGLYRSLSQSLRGRGQYGGSAQRSARPQRSGGYGRTRYPEERRWDQAPAYGPTYGVPYGVGYGVPVDEPYPDGGGDQYPDEEPFEEPLDEGIDGMEPTAASGQGTGRWVRRGRRIILFGA